MDWISIGKIIWGKLTGKKNISDIEKVEKLQGVLFKHIDFITSDYEERIKYIQEEKIKHPENGFELLKHLETLEFYYHLTIKLNQENIDLREELLFIKKSKNKLP